MTTGIHARFLQLWLLAAGCFCPESANAETIVVSKQDNWFERLAGDLAPGDELVFRAGVYSDPRRLVLRHRGSASKPIVIRAAKGERVVFKRPDSKQNTFNLEGTQYLVLQGFEITGGAAGVRIGPDRVGNEAHNVTLQDLHIHHIGGVAVTCNFKSANYKEMVFRRNHIHHSSGHGEAFYLGANNGAAEFYNSVIENNYIHHLNGPNVSQGDGIEIKQASYGNRVVRNVIHDTNYPAITVYGTNGRSQNLVEDNLIWNTGDHGIQAAADAAVQRNFIANSGGCGIYSREHQGAVPSNLRIELNYVVSGRNPALRLIGNNSQSTDIRVFRNVLLGNKGSDAVRIEGVAELIAEGNRGIGMVVGDSEFDKSWSLADQEHPVTLPDLPDLDGNPALQFFNEAELRRRLAAKQ